MIAQRSQGGALVLADHGVRIPLDVGDLACFRRWARSEDFPERGKISYLAGELEVDMSPEDVNTHGSLKVAIVSGLDREVESRDLGLLYADRMRLSNEDAGLSVEPDALLVLWRSVESGRTRPVPKASAEEGRYVELEGSADLVVECVSDSSLKKDTDTLRALYHAAGVREYWIADARTPPVTLTVLTHEPAGYIESPEVDGWRRSPLLDRAVRLVAAPPRAGLVRYRLEAR